MKKILKKIPREIVLAMKYVPDGQATSIRGVDFLKAANNLLPLDELLTWPGLEAYMKTLPQEKLPITHTFSGGVYIREMHIPKGIFIIGKRHRHETCNILLKGTLSVCIDNGKVGPVNKINGPVVLTSEPMVRKIAYCHEDAVFLNIHPTEETDIDKIEDEFIITEQQYLALKGENQCLGEQ